jgi:long-chain acyl-CoA synthetase
LKKFTKGKPVRSVPVADDFSHRVLAENKGNLGTVPASGATTLHECFSKALVKHGSSIAMRKRNFLGWKSAKVKEFGPEITEMTYAEVGEKAFKFGAALAATGRVPSDPVATLEKVTKPCRIAIFENTCAEWMIAALGAFSQSLGVATVYATLGIESVGEAVVDNSISVIVCNKVNVKYLVESSKNMPCLKTIVYTSDLIGKDMNVDMPTTVPSGLTVISFEDFVESGDTAKYPVVPPTAEMAAVIMYTSGSTGKPKGVVVKHSAIISGVAAAESRIKLDESVSYLGYLPLAHIMELMYEFCLLGTGASINYADPKSLTATGSYPKGALEVYGPTHMVAVPKIWDTIKKAIAAKVAASPPVKQALVNTALQWRAFAVTIGLDTPLFNALVFKKLKAVVGGNLQHAISGGGPLNSDVQKFITVAFGFPLVQGYGLTETSAGLTIQEADDTRCGVAGSLISTVEVRLDSTPEICDKAGVAYLKTDRKDVDGNDVWGRGEILVRGGNVTSGYYMMPEKTKEVFLEDGWFATGDIGQFLEDGTIKIVDRKKNLVKLKSGEYVALEKMEMVYGNSVFVDAVAGGICCYGDGEMDRCVALFQIAKPASMQWATATGLIGEEEKEGDWEKVKNSTELYDHVMADFAKEHANSDLSHIEKLKAVVMLDSPWTPENGCLTAANKLQRRKVIEDFAKEFEEVRKKGIF